MVQYIGNTKFAAADRNIRVTVAATAWTKIDDAVGVQATSGALVRAGVGIRLTLDRNGWHGEEGNGVRFAIVLDRDDPRSPGVYVNADRTSITIVNPNPAGYRYTTTKTTVDDHGAGVLTAANIGTPNTGTLYANQQKGSFTGGEDGPLRMAVVADPTGKTILRATPGATAPAVTADSKNLGWQLEIKGEQYYVVVPHEHTLWAISSSGNAAGVQAMIFEADESDTELDKMVPQFAMRRGAY